MTDSVGQVEPVRVARGVAEIGHRTEPLRRHDDVAREPAVDVVAREDLLGADRPLARGAGHARAARDHRRDDHLLPDPRLGARAGVDHLAR